MRGRTVLFLVLAVAVALVGVYTANAAPQASSQRAAGRSGRRHAATSPTP